MKKKPETEGGAAPRPPQTPAESGAAAAREQDAGGRPSGAVARPPREGAENWAAGGRPAGAGGRSTGAVSRPPQAGGRATGAASRPPQAGGRATGAASRPPQAGGRPIGADVAKAVGVSAKTVSNAYRRPDQLSVDLRERIFAVAADLGYVGPDAVASGLRRGHVGAVGFLYGNRLSYAFDDPVSRELLSGITGVLEASRVGLLLVPGAAEVLSPVDGYIFASLADDDPRLAARPAVVIDQPRAERAWVGIDDRAAAVELAALLASLGHRRVGVITFGMWRDEAPGEPTLAVSLDRLAGYREVFPDAAVFYGNDSTQEQGEAGAEQLLAGKPTALLCMSDRLADGALRVAARHGLRVPEDLSVVGFDGWLPGLTTIEQPTREKGERAARMLLEGSSERVLLPTRLVVGTSTAPPPAAA